MSFGRIWAADGLLIQGKWFARPGTVNSEYVLQIPVKFWEASRGRMDNPATHYGWYPVSNLNPALRRRIQATLTVPPPAGKPAEIRRIKEEVLRILNAEMYPDLFAEVTTSFDSDQLISIQLTLLIPANGAFQS